MQSRRKLISGLLMGMALLAAGLFLGLSLWIEVEKQVEAQWIRSGVPVIVEDPYVFVALQTDLPITGLILPDSGLYLLDAGGDRFRLWLTRGDVPRYERLLDLADERMGAARELMARGEGKRGVEAMVKGVHYWESARLLWQSMGESGVVTDLRQRLVDRGEVYRQLLILAKKQLNEPARVGVERILETVNVGLEQTED